MAFCTIYPLTKQKGQIKSGFRLWLSKASVMYPTVILGSMIMIGALSYFNGFSPYDLGKTMLVAGVAATTFISIIYLVSIVFGKIGQFITLILMVIQLSGATGTYPVELSGDFVAKITNYLPFTHVVKAFRSTISGGCSIENNLIFLAFVSLIAIILTIVYLQLKVRLKEEEFIDTDLNEKLAV